MPKPASLEFSKREVLFILVFFLIALFLRIMYLNEYIHTAIYPLLDYSDSYSYYLWAKDIASGDFFGTKAFMKWPLYAYFLGLYFWLFQENLTTIFSLQSALGAINCILVYLIARI